MNAILDPVWPWSHLWDVLQRVPASIRLVAVGAAAAALVLPILMLARRSKRAIYATASVVAVCLAVFGRNAWPIVHGSSFWLAVGSVLGLCALIVVPPALTGVSIGTYLGASNVTRRRLAVIIGLRLLAFALALVALTRPALAWIDREQARSQVLILVDRSRSMTVQDAIAKASRWEAVQRALQAGGPALDRLRDELGVEVRMLSFADDLADWDLEHPGAADGKRSEIGMALRGGLDRRDPRLTLRGALLLSDGADNGAVAALGEATRYRGLGAALHTFVVGNPATTPKQNDIAITSISTSPTPFIPLKGKMTVKVSIDARGFENSKQTVVLQMELPDVTGKLTYQTLERQDISLPLTIGNEMTLTTDKVPAVPGEYKIKVLLEKPGDEFPSNNEIETFVTVSKEGISVLLVDRVRGGWEPQFLINALAEDSRMSIDRVWVGNAPPAGGKSTLLDDKPFDVIILGDVSVAQLKEIDANFLAKLKRQMARGAGLLVLGGYINLGNGDWKDSALAELLPVDLSRGGQIDSPIRITPTEDGLKLAPYILRLDDDPDLKMAWSKLAKLDGATQLTLLPADKRGTDLVLATADDEKKTPLLVMRTFAGEGDKKGEKTTPSRILVFGGDTTFRWTESQKTRPIHSRFWRQTITWLARQEDARGSVWVRPDATSRRLPVRSDLGFTVGIRGKGGGPDIRDGKYIVEVAGPDGVKSSVALTRGTSETRGNFKETKKPGTYTITVSGEGKDASGEVVSGQSSARVIVYDEDVELTRPAADPEFMRKLATAGGGEALSIAHLAEFLNRLAEQPIERGKQRMELRPDWRTTAPSGFLPTFFGVFVLIVGLEWALRRWWGLV